ncbi:hypothetical protein V6N12_030392 [Hibiscus sabdariffa]|uniref:Reverse transcriptase zinc-binding domain-containing protein n=1 Tax=Hibiscus sabdariffa TaxID=183260 RepID=A0ABR2C0R7_9ROSI
MGLGAFIFTHSSTSFKENCSYAPPNPALGTDTFGWRGEENKRFTTRSAYRVLCPRVLENAHSSWRIIWALQVPQLVRVFMWLVLREALLTNVERTRRHMSTSSIYRLCNRDDEDVLHVLRGCQRPRSIWLSLLSPNVFPMFMSLPLEEWVLANINPHGSCSRDDPEWSVRFVVFCWLLWKRRCGLLLDDGYVDRGDFVAHGLKLASDFTDGIKSKDSLARMFCGAPIGNETFAEPPLEAVATMLHDLPCLL